MSNDKYTITSEERKRNIDTLTEYYIEYQDEWLPSASAEESEGQLFKRAKSKREYRGLIQSCMKKIENGSIEFEKLSQIPSPDSF
ncbi:unnamed protein product [Ambrosiozyma monospora]|uniref:Unnamed protein product n=1 Tax=Ambrosiozyma monospora TaxID=43982 RepID=A0ACB5SWS9_AMBMO|nr:unnamed protein product [Ambrosiozyma monospora]